MLIPSKYSGYRADGIRIYPGKNSGGSSTPPPDPALVAAQIRSMGYQDEAIQQMMANNAALAPLQREQMQFGLESARKAYEQSQEDRSWALDRRGSLTTLQDRLVDDANSFNQEGRTEQLASEAIADVNKSFSNVREQQSRAMSRMGVNPASGKAQAGSDQITIAQAATQAGAANSARTKARVEGYSLNDRAVGALSGSPTMGMQTTGAGAGYGASGLGMTNAALAGMNSGFGMVSQAAGGLGSNSAGMYGVQASFKNSQDQIASNNDPMKTLIGAGMGAGMAYMTGGLSTMGKNASWAK